VVPVRRVKIAAVPVPARDLDGMRRSHAGVLADLAGLADDVARRPSRLPGWTVGHVVTHLARNADSVTRRLAGAARGEVVDQYAGGAAGRAGEIEEGSDRPASVLVEDLRVAQERLEAAADTMPDGAWDGLTRGVDGDERPAWRLPFGRWREVEVHRVDLGLGHEPADWPDELVARWLPDVLATLPDRTDPPSLLAWALGRTPTAPALGPWD
jgi:maleylpyruvate isomerase